jgi:hypothetical protein
MSSLDARSAWQVPVQWPQAAGASTASPAADRRVLKAAIVVALLALTVLDRFGLRVAGDTSIPVSMLAMYALAAAMVLGGAAELNLRAAGAYLAVLAVATLSFTVNTAFSPPPYVSKMSLLFLIAIYAPLCLSLRAEAGSPERWRRTVELYVAFAVAVGLAGIAQYFVQFVFRPAWLFDYTELIPERLRATSGWNTSYTVSVNSPAAWTKSNGFFMREPSIFSIVMAFGLICEWSLARRRWVMGVLALGLVLSYSGSGLLCLAVAMLFPLGRGTLARLAAFALLGAAIFLLFGETLNLSYMVDRYRSDELFVKNTSAYCRFVAPAADAVRLLNSDPWTSLLGHGPGSMIRIGAGCADNYAQTTFAKLIIEYGLLGALAFGALVVGALNRSGAPLRMRVAAGVTWLLLGGNLLDSMYLLFVYLISAMWPQGAARAAAEKPHADAGRAA